MIGTGKEGVALCQAIKGQRTEAYGLVCFLRKEAVQLFKSEGIGIQDQSRANDGTTGEAAAGRNVTVQNHVNTENHDNRKQQEGDLLQNAVILGLIVLLPSCLYRSFALIFFLIVTQKDQHGAGGNEQHIGFTKGIEGTIIQDHTSHNIYRTGILHTILNIFLYHFVTGRVLGVANRRKIRNCQQQHSNQRYAADNGNDFIKYPEAFDHPVTPLVKNHTDNGFPIPLMLTDKPFIGNKLALFLALHISQVGVCLTLGPLNHLGQGFCVILLFGNGFTHRPHLLPSWRGFSSRLQRIEDSLRPHLQLLP